MLHNSAEFSTDISHISEQYTQVINVTRFILLSFHACIDTDCIMYAQTYEYYHCYASWQGKYLGVYILYHFGFHCHQER